MHRRDVLAGAAVAALPCAWAAPAVRVGVAPGPNAEILEHLHGDASGSLALDVAVLAHERALADALARGALDAACFADGVRFADGRGADPYPLVVLATTVTLPMALYSRSLRSPRQLRDGATIALPAEAASLARALVLLQNFGVLTLRDDVGLHATLRDVVANPRRCLLVARPSHALHVASGDAAIAVLPYDDATREGLEPARDSIGLEDARSPWAGVLVAARAQAREPRVAALVAAYRSEGTKRFVLERWHDSVRRPW